MQTKFLLIRHSDLCFNFTTWDELVHLPIHQEVFGTIVGDFVLCTWYFGYYIFIFYFSLIFQKKNQFSNFLYSLLILIFCDNMHGSSFLSCIRGNNLVPLDLEIEATCKRNNAPRRKREQQGN